MTAVQEEACNLLSALATEYADGRFHSHIFDQRLKWSNMARNLALVAFKRSIDTGQITAAPHENYAEAEALIRDGRVR